MVPSHMILKKDEVAHKIAELKQWLNLKETSSYKAYIDEGGNARTAKDKVIAELKMEDSGEWEAKEVEYEELRKTHATMSFVLDTLQKMISTVSAGYMSVEEYSKWVESYEEFFKA